MKHIKPEQYEIIKNAAELESQIVIGERNQLEKRYAVEIRLIEGLHSRDVAIEKLPKRYAVIAWKNENIGTKKWSHIVKETEIEYFDAKDSHPAKWTSKSFVTYNSYGEVSRVISIDKIVAVMY